MYIKIDFNSARLPYYKQKINAKGEKTWVDDIKKGMDTITHQSYGIKHSVKRYNRLDTLVSNLDCGNRFGTAETPIHLEQVSNMLHVMLGERPVSTFHPLIVNGRQIFKRLDFIDEIVKNGFFKINNTFTYVKNDEQTDIISECTKFQKCGPSNPTGYDVIYWNRFEKLVKTSSSAKYYDTVIDIFNKYSKGLNVIKTYASLTEFVTDIKLRNLYDACLADITKQTKNCIGILTGDFARPTSKGQLGVKNEVNSVKKTICISGSFIFDVDDETYSRITKGCRTATFLDGGLATLEKWDFGSYGNEYLTSLDIKDNGYQKIV